MTGKSANPGAEFLWEPNREQKRYSQYPTKKIHCIAFLEIGSPSWIRTKGLRYQKPMFYHSTKGE